MTYQEVSTREVAAHSAYRTFSCDHCHRPIGYDGMVKVEDHGVVSLVLSSLCAECKQAGKRLWP